MITFFGKLRDRIKNISIRKDLVVISLICMILPLIIADGIVFYTLYKSEETDIFHETENIANAVKYDIEYFMEEGITISNNIYLDNDIYEFLDTRFKNNLECYTATNDILDRASFNSYTGRNVMSVTVYADNDTLAGGGSFRQLDTALSLPWYKKLNESGANSVICVYYTGDVDPSSANKRHICLARKLDYNKSGAEKILLLEYDYKRFARSLSSRNYDYGVYICHGDTILFSNRGHSSNQSDFASLTGNEKFIYEDSYSISGEDVRICITGAEDSVSKRILGRLPLIFFMLLINLFLPVFIVKAVYEDRLERQEAEIARQSAELMALHSQINPHFLFNVLETIRMRCLIAGESVTAGMIEKLAILERQTINWASDLVTLKEEMRFIEAYLELQKYRFGERLHYDIDLPDELMDCLLPKLTLTVFVENSCVHGMEAKSSACWVYVRAYKKDDEIIVEVEDTGDGIDEAEVEDFNRRMTNITIDDIKESEHVGVFNGCLRLNMYSEGNANFTMESEKGAGTFITIRINEKYTRPRE